MAGVIDHTSLALAYCALPVTVATVDDKPVVLSVAVTLNVYSGRCAAVKLLAPRGKGDIVLVIEFAGKVTVPLTGTPPTVAEYVMV